MNKWDRRFLGLANLVATWSKDPSTGVGAVIVDSKNRVVSLGFNGFPRAVEDKEVTRDEKLRRTIHAEENALLFARTPVEGCTIYVTHPPCARCAAKIIQAGIARVVSHEPAQDFADRWFDDMASAAEMLEEAGVGFEYLGEVPANSGGALKRPMNNDDGCPPSAGQWWLGGLAGNTLYGEFAIEVARRAVVAEREACAKVCENVGKPDPQDPNSALGEYYREDVAQECAAAIRDRSNDGSNRTPRGAD